jgi:protocatechuate 3,4-dioxygenase beta subunit
MKLNYSLISSQWFGLRPTGPANNRSRIGRCWPFAFALCALACLAFVPVTIGHAHPIKSTPLQTQLAPIGILPFQDESGLNAPPALGQNVADDLRQKLIVNFKDVLPRMLGAGVDPSTLAAMSFEQAAALGKQNGVKFVVRGGLLAVTDEQTGDGTKISVQLYANIISVESGSDINVRAEGSGAQTGPVADLSTVDPKGAAFRDSALGQAFAAATAQIANAIHDAIISPAQDATTSAQSTPTPDSAAVTTDTAATQAVAADQETQQLIAQAEATLAGNPNGSTENMNALRQALEGLKTALATKAGLLQESKDTSTADQEIATHKQEMQIALANLTAEASAVNTSAQTQQPGSQKKDVLASIDAFAGEAMSLLQKIQELRSTLRSVNEDQSVNNAPPQDSTVPQDVGTQPSPPVEQTSGTVSGVVTNDGNPVAGTTVTNPETGQSTTTDTNGAFTLKGLIPGRLSQLILTKNGQLIGKGQVDLPNGRTAIADFQTNSLLATRMSGGALPGVLASTMVSNPAKHPGASIGTLKGEVRDAAGRPVPFALVQIPGVGMVRTNAQGQYAFINVPVGTYQLMVQPSGMKPKSSQVAVAAKTITDARTQFAPADKMTTINHSLMMAGTGVVLRGTVLDEQAHPVAAAKISVIQSEATVSVLTAPTGTFELRSLKPGAYQVTAYKVGYQVASQAVTLKATGAEERNFQLSPVASASLNNLIRNALATQGEIRGTLRTQTGAPVANASVEVRATGKALLLTKTLTNAKGEYALKLAAGSYDLKAKQQSFQDGVRTVAVRAGGTMRADFELKQGTGLNGIGGNTRFHQTETLRGQLTGRVTDGNGKPLAGASIALQHQRRATTDQAGNYVLSGLPPDSYRIAVSKDSFAVEEKTINIRANSSTRQDFVLKATSSAINRQSTGNLSIASGLVAGRIVDGKTGAPIAGVAISIAGQRATTTGADGSYSFTNLAPGTYQITARKSGFVEAQQSVTIRGADTVRANFALSSTSIRSIRIPKRS